MNSVKFRYAPAVLGLAGAVGVLPSATAAVFEILGVSNGLITCPADAGSGTNCRVQNIPQVTCPAGQDPLSVNVFVGPANMNSRIQATAEGEPGCYNVEDISHLQLRLRVRDPGNEANSILDLNGGAGNSDGSPFDGTASCDNVAPWNNSLPFLWYGTAGQQVDQPNVVVTNKGPLAVANFVPSDPEWSVFYGAGTFEGEFSSQASSDVSQSGTWGASIVTNATGSLTLGPVCESPREPPPVPAIGPLGLGALGLGLAGLGVMLGFRRR